MSTLVMLKNLTRYLLTRGLSLHDELRLRVALINYFIHYIYYLVARSFGGISPGYYIPGQKPLRIRTWDGYAFLVRPKTPDISMATMSMEAHELKNWFLPYAKGVVVDVGANIGGYAVRACKHADLVIAIEPEESTFGILQKT